MAGEIVRANRYGNPVRNAQEGSRRILRANERSITAERRELFNYGTAFQGQRDYYEILGYLPNPAARDYRARFDRDPVAGRIIEFPPEETWRDTPTIKDGRDKDAVDDTPFCTQWEAFAEKMHVYRYCQRVDTLAGIGRFAILHIGVAGQTDLTQPVVRVSHIDDIIYLQAYAEDSVAVHEWQTDPGNPRYGLPHIYRLRISHMEGPIKDTFGARELHVHWSRCIHVAEGLLENEVYGRPRLQRVINLLDDLLKVVGGSAEATWLLMRKGFVLDIDPDAEDLTADEKESLYQQFEEYEHGITRFIKTRGMNVRDLGSESVDPSGLFDAILTLISVATHVPKRILQGSEAGELASSQDASNWAGYVAGRQLNHAEPVILRPIVDRMVEWKAIPKPKNKQYTCVWDALFEMSDEEKANIANLWATAMQKASLAVGHPVVIAEEFRGEFTPFAAKLPKELRAARLRSTMAPPPVVVPGKPGAVSPTASLPGQPVSPNPTTPPSALMNRNEMFDEINQILEEYGYGGDIAPALVTAIDGVIEEMVQ